MLKVSGMHEAGEIEKKHKNQRESFTQKPFSYKGNYITI